MKKNLLFIIPIITSLLSVYVNYSQAAPVDIKTYIPTNAYALLPTLKSETDRIFSDTGTPEYFGGLIEQESCISLTHSRCWKPSSQLKTSREEGAGVGQLTRAYNQDGSIRFDALTDLRNRYTSELKELSWSNVYQRPDLQIRSILLMSRDNWKRFPEVRDPFQRVAFMDAAYNGGAGGAVKERLQCGLTKGCNPQFWFGHVEKVCLKSKKPIYGNRSACDINREHVDLVIHYRMNKYVPYLRLGNSGSSK